MFSPFSLFVFSFILEFENNGRIMQMCIRDSRYTSYDIRRQMEISDQLLGWITYNRKLQEILTANYSEKYEKQLDIIQFSSYATEYAINANIENNIFKILIIEDNGESFQIGNVRSLMDQDAIKDARWAETYNHSKADQLVLSKDIYAKDTYVFPVSSRIYNDLTLSLIHI